MQFLSISHYTTIIQVSVQLPFIYLKKIFFDSGIRLCINIIVLLMYAIILSCWLIVFIICKEILMLFQRIMPFESSQ